MLDMPDIKGQCYKELIRVLFEHCDIVKWRVIDDFEEVSILFESIQSECLETSYNLKGRQSIKEYTFQFSFFVKQFLFVTTDSLFSWTHPYPEDLSFYKNNECLFSSLTHEKQYGIHISLKETIENVIK